MDRLRELPTPSVQYSMPIGDETQVNCCYTVCYTVSYTVVTLLLQCRSNAVTLCLCPVPVPAP
jgi:hypothetical protein